ncbi:MAG: hypothetical protein M1834_000944 [Cirrosporium novae-zelandiae]|nr:MAG: hypothetical protein M1834_000944 [Cirrosporium novae-zelandiae]
MDTIQLPYFADTKSLPAPLPTHDEIENSEVLSGYGGRRIVRVNQHFIVKYGPGVDLIEGENMLFINRETSIPVPQVYAIYSDYLSDKQYIVMENIVGNTLAVEWHSLSRKQKELISNKLRTIWDQLRNLPSPGYFGSLHKRSFRDPLFFSGNRATSLSTSGPFDTENAMNEALIKRYLLENLPVNKANFYRTVFSSVFQNHPSIFTHGDLQRKNIIITPVVKRIGFELDSTNSRKTYGHDYIVTIIDWQYAGWYPSYWEYSTALYCCGRWGDDWSQWIEKILDPFVNEYAWMQLLRTDLWT